MARDFAIQNPDQLLENMALMRDILKEQNIPCFLHYGTLLGAIREKNFIAHDDDADIGVFGQDFDAVIGLLPVFLAKGFTFNSQRNGRLLQFVRNGEQVDIFFAYKKIGLTGSKWSIDDRATVSSSFLDTLIPLLFLGEEFLIPSNSEALLRNLYGKTWRIPLKGIPSRTNWTWRLKKILSNPTKIFYYFRRFLKTQKRKSST
jgi:lipopolysaccharide cholinephosphotransferase